MRKTGHTATSVVLFLICVMYFITYIDRVNISTAAIVFRKELNLSNSDYGNIFAAFGYTYALFQISGGWLGDRLGPRATLGVCGLIWALATLCTGLATGFWTLILARLVLGLGEGATFPTSTRAMSNWTRAGWRGFAQGITHSFARIGNAVAPPLVAAIITVWSWRGSFILLGLASLAWVIVWYGYFRNDPREHRGISEEELKVLPPYGARKESADVPWGRLVPRMLPTTLVYFCWGWTFWLFLSWIPQYFQQGHGMSLTGSAWSAAIVASGGVIGDTVGGLLSDRIYRKTGDLTKARRNMIIASFLSAFVFLLPLFFVDNVAVLTACLAITFFCIELTIGPIWAVPMDIAPKYSGTASGIMNTGSAIAAIVSPMAFGYLVDWTGSWRWPFSGSIALLLIGAVLTFWIRPDRKIEEAADTELVAKAIKA
ncbi:MAG TPA: MFS transporter [Stellaceae bacterium]|nr:MFS transporter [Stellaceae bacterium]